MTDDTSRPISEHVVRHLAGRGNAEIDRMQDLIHRARALLENGELSDADITTYWWELDRAIASDHSVQIWVTYISDYATGAGLTSQIYVARAHSEADFRRQLSWQFNRNVAHYAVVAQGEGALDEIAPGASSLLAPAIRERLVRIEEGEDRPAAFSVLVQVHANYA
ncbi:hypothetical protein M2336_002667 [Sphingobium sp. B1D7B]|uniref:hypothetical protein n=1 Tax=unclassified Sphingobium TaxID=2611147 RepID=UPI0022242D89|nr:MULTISPECIES: hypothetical protein [unclassified Sphingobium]MCW2390895.1 hypothetical protein [Sphingobium sp. B11D3A]MCW2406038.1 hypothetical protein [Sphingobium sp. B1D7B]